VYFINDIKIESKKGNFMADAFLKAQLKNPITGAPAAIVDVRDRVASLSKPSDPRSEAAFIAARLNRIAANPRLTGEQKALLLARFQSARGAEAPVPDPVPGIPGYGFNFLHAFNVAYTNGTAITYQVICPTTVGGNFTNFLYLTSTNRASYGLEAYVSYPLPSSVADFNIYDWSLAQTNLQHGFLRSYPFSMLGQYLSSLSTNGQIYQTLFVHNVTFETGNNQWMNAAYLFNGVTLTWDCFYSSVYTATLAQQQSFNLAGFWGPIVETHEASGFVFKGVSTVGFFQTQVSTTDGAGTPVTLTLLDPSNSFFDGANFGFQQVFLNPNYDWAADAP